MADALADTATPVAKDADAPASDLDNDGLFKKLKDQFAEDDAHSSDWRIAAYEDFELISNRPWEQKEIEYLTSPEGGSRVPISFNYAISIIKVIGGMEIHGRHEIRFIPRGSEDTEVNELLTGASKWMADECDGEDEESEAFQRAATCGMGWVEERLAYDEDPDGAYVEDSIHPLEMRWDKRARKKNLSDARRLWHVRKMPMADAKAMFPDAERSDLNAAWATGNDTSGPDKSIEQKRLREPNTGEDGDDDRDEVTVVQCQWWEHEPYYLVADPISNQKQSLSVADFRKIEKLAKEKGLPLQSVKLTRKVFKRAFLGGKVLEEGPAPCKDHFSFKCITGEQDLNKGTWFGLARIMRDPQRWSNKFLMTILHILGTTSKGGILAEEDAFVDIKTAEKDYANSQSIVKLKKGAISGQNPKIMPRPGAGDPSAYSELLQFSIGAVRSVTGINMETIGQRDVNQPGILEMLRKQAAMTILATMFDSLRRFRKQVGRTRLYFIQEFMSDGRWIRLSGKEGAKAAQLLKDKTVGRYDVIVDDAPTSPNQKDANWQIISQLLPAFKDQLVQYPQVLAEVLDNSPLPSRLVETIKAAMQQPNPDQDRAKKIAEAGAVAKVGKDQAQAELYIAQAKGTEATAVYDLAWAHTQLLKFKTGDATPNDQERALDIIGKAADIETKRSQIAKTNAETDATKAKTFGTHVGTAIDALSPIPHDPPMVNRSGGTPQAA